MTPKDLKETLEAGIFTVWCVVVIGLSSYDPEAGFKALVGSALTLLVAVAAAPLFEKKS